MKKNKNVKNNQVISKYYLNKYKEPIKPTDINLVDMLRLSINKFCINGNVGDIFINSNKEFSKVYNLNNSVQRMVVNRELSELLLKFRAHNEYSVVGVLGFLVNNGTNEDWLKSLNRFVIPVMCEHSMFKVGDMK